MRDCRKRSLRRCNLEAACLDNKDKPDATFAVVVIGSVLPVTDKVGSKRSPRTERMHIS